MLTNGNLNVSCDEAITNGCLVGGDHWVLVERDNGTFDLLIAETGLPADPADIIECPDGQEATTVATLALVNPWSSQYGLVSLGTLSYWEVRAEALPVTLNVNGVSFAMDLNETVASKAQDNRILDDSINVSISGAGRASIVSRRRANT